MDPISGYQLGSIALKALSKTVEHLNGEQDDELTARVRLIYEAAATDFFAEVGNEFGRPGSTFVDREDNVVAVVRSMFYHGDPLAAEALSFEGFDQSPRATHAAVGRFVELVMVHMQKDFPLGHLLADQEHLRNTQHHHETSEKQNLKMMEDLAAIKASLNRGSDARYRVTGGRPGDTFELEDGRVYTDRLNERTRLSYVRKGGKIYADAELPEGQIRWTLAPGSLNVAFDNDLLHWMKIRVPSEFIASEKRVSLGNGGSRLVIEGPLGFRVDQNISADGRLQSVATKHAEISVKFSKFEILATPKYKPGQG